jgi:hypothetical protein
VFSLNLFGFLRAAFSRWEQSGIFVWNCFMTRKLTCVAISLAVCVSLFSQVNTLQAFKTNTPPKIDGVLDDAVWKEAPIASSFIQNFPHAGQPASQRSEVRIAYDNTAIYLAAHLFDDPTLIRRQITARDEEQGKDLDYFAVFLDTYHDHQNSFQFLVTSSNVQTDARISPGTEAEESEESRYGDKTWDAVWDSKVSIVTDGWIVEMKIPYFSLRFSPKMLQSWGLQLQRFVRRNNETTFWNNVDPNVNGFVNQFGLLDNLVDVKPPLRLSFSPYVSTGVRNTPEKSGYGTEWLRSGGMDVKYGINESFTLDATLIPDFGQVVSDNVVNNLTPYEVRFEEYRPFFTEGIDIFNKSGLFYSRRIGATPGGFQAIHDLVDTTANLELIKNPARTKLYNAIKFSGRTSKKLGIGFFNAIGSPMYAVVEDKNNGKRQKIKTEPLTNYNIVVLDQALKGRSYITFTNTNVIRNSSHRDANVSGLDISMYDASNTYNIKATGRYSKIFHGDSYDGFNTSMSLAKVSGKFRYEATSSILSENYDPTDLGYLLTPNQQTHSASVSYNQFTPTKRFLNYSYSVDVLYHRLYKPNQFNDVTFSATGFWYFKNFWDLTLTAAYLPDQHDYFVTGAPFAKYARRPQYGFLQAIGNTDNRKRLYFNYDFLVSDFFKNPEKKYYNIGGGVRYRFSDKLSLDLSNRYETETDYITPASPDASGEPRVNFVDFKEVTSVLSGIYNFTPRINLTLRVRHYWSNVLVKRIVYLDTKGYPTVPLLALAPYTDNINFFNTDAFFTWDFRYGSRLIVGYKNWLGDHENVDGTRYKKYLSNFGQVFNLRHANEFTVRFIYFLDYHQLKKGK